MPKGKPKQLDDGGGWNVVDNNAKSKEHKAKKAAEVKAAAARRGARRANRGKNDEPDPDLYDIDLDEYCDTGDGLKNKVTPGAVWVETKKEKKIKESLARKEAKEAEKKKKLGVMDPPPKPKPKPRPPKLVKLCAEDCDVDFKILGATKRQGTSKRAKMWAGARATHGASSGKVAYAVKIREGRLARVGWGTAIASRNLGHDKEGWGYGGTGMSSNNDTFTPYGERYTLGDVITCLLDFDECTVSFMKNGDHLGVAFNCETIKDTFILPQVFTSDAVVEVFFSPLEVHEGDKKLPKLPSGYMWLAHCLDCELSPWAPGSKKKSTQVAKKILTIEQVHGIEPPDVKDILYQAPPSVVAQITARWQERCGSDYALKAIWQVKNPYLAAKYEARKKVMTKELGKRPDIIEGFHGSAAVNILPICQWGFDPTKRKVMVYGTGDYFAKDPTISVMYCKGDCYMMLCSLLLGKEKSAPEAKDGDYIWVPGCRYYVLHQADQVLPMYVLKFNNKFSSNPLDVLVNPLSALDSGGKLKQNQTGADTAGAYHRRCTMVAESTKYLWVGYLDPTLDDDELEDDVEDFLDGLAIDQILPEHEGLRRAAKVILARAVSRSAVQELNRRRYQGKYIICIDDCQPNNPAHKGKVCPRLTGPASYCRWSNISHVDFGCDFAHPEKAVPTKDAAYVLESIQLGSAKAEELVTHFMSTAPFHTGTPVITAIKKIVNPKLSQLYESRKIFQDEKHSSGCSEVELYHGTNCNILPILYTHGLKVPSDCQASEECPRSGGKGLSTTLCDNTCKYCTKKHEWERCHMYGLGIYLADMAQKSHRYVSCPRVTPQGAKEYKIVKCRAALGNPYLIEGHLKDGKNMHDVIYCKDVRDKIDSIVEQEWAEEDNDSYYVKGLGADAKVGHSVVNSEYIVFSPYQVLPVYEITYQVI